jgi:hypothetical protein
MKCVCLSCSNPTQLALSSSLRNRTHGLCSFTRFRHKISTNVKEVMHGAASSHRCFNGTAAAFRFVALAFADETIITWSDAEIGTDVALSFQEAGGCDAVW